MTEPISDDAIDQLFADYLASPKAERTRGASKRRSNGTKLPRPEWMPEARSVRVTPRGAAQTSWWVAQRVAEASLVERRASQEELDDHRINRDVKRLNEEIVAKSFKPKPGAMEEEKKLDIQQKIHGVWL